MNALSVKVLGKLVKGIGLVCCPVKHKPPPGGVGWAAQCCLLGEAAGDRSPQLTHRFLILHQLCSWQVGSLFARSLWDVLGPAPSVFNDKVWIGGICPSYPVECRWPHRSILHV